jgi:hypothetical protein
VEEEEESTISGDGALHEASDEYRIYARRRYSAGEEVFICYGRHTNLELLIHYGFVLPDNPHDVAPLPLSTLPTAAIEHLGPDPEGKSWVGVGGAPSWELLRALRLAGAAPTERRARAWLALDDRPIGAESEAWALSALGKACQLALEELPTTLEEDEGALREEGLSACGAVAIEWRVAHKRLLRRAIEGCQVALRTLAQEGKSV